MTLVRNGRAVWNSGTVARANADGLGGRDRLNSFREARFRLLTTGDSATHWMQDGLTIPDIVAERITDRTHVRTANLNFARGSYGVLQMLTIAAAKSTELSPDVVVIQFISDDLTRAGWWSREVKINGRTRAQVSTAPDGFDDRAQTSDEYIVDARATDDFCDRVVAAGGDDPIIREANAFYRDYRKWKRLDRDPFSLRHFYIFEALEWRLTGRNPNAAESLLPRTDARHFTADVGFHEAAVLHDCGATVMLVHLPLPGELVRGSPILDRESAEVWAELERSLGTHVRTFWNATDQPKPPAKIDLAPFNGHPNFDGLRFYGD